MSAAALSALCLAACGGDDEPQQRAETPASAETAAPTPAVDQWGCEVINTPTPKDVKLAPPSTEPDPAKTYVAVVETNCGFFEITLDAKRAPKTAASFMSLAIQKFYNGTTVHRIVPDSIIQGGDPT